MNSDQVTIMALKFWSGTYSTWTTNPHPLIRWPFGKSWSSSTILGQPMRSDHFPVIYTWMEKSG
ncbi:hypothetical protein, partial [Pseudomonas aeruginosa]|uniref:hypothetical protein n=1 Tax=Pseudomonas aeruginosa TaxID=287 RepID=UPI003D2A473A